MATRKTIIELLKEKDMTIGEMQYRSKFSENALRVTLNRELKPENIVLETNKYRYKYKVYTLNTPKNMFDHLYHIYSYFDMLKWRIYGQYTLAKRMVNCIDEFISSLEELYKISREERKIKKAINTRINQKHRFEIYFNTFSEYWKIFETYLKEIRNLYKKWKLQCNNNEIDSNNDFNRIFYIERILHQAIEKFIKSEKSAKKYIDNLKSPKF